MCSPDNYLNLMHILFYVKQHKSTIIMSHIGLKLYTKRTFNPLLCKRVCWYFSKLKRKSYFFDSVFPCVSVVVHLFFSVNYLQYYRVVKSAIKIFLHRFVLTFLCQGYMFPLIKKKKIKINGVQNSQHPLKK